MAKSFFITGTQHGVLVYAITEGIARKGFHDLYRGESILSVRDCITGKWLQRPPYSGNYLYY